MSDLFSSSRAELAIDRMDALRPEMGGGHHGAQRRLDRPLRVGEEVGDAGQRLVRLGVEDVQDRADKQRVARLLPVVAALQRAFGVDQDVGDVLDVADLAIAAAHLQQRIVGVRVRAGRIELQHPAEARAPARRHGPVLALDVVHDGAAGPGEQRRHDEANALAASRGREAQDVLRPVVAKVVPVEPTEDRAVVAEHAGRADLPLGREAGRAVGGRVSRFAGAPDRHGDRDHDRGKAAGRGDVGSLHEHGRRVGIEVEPPPEERGRRIDRHAAPELEPRRAELRLVAEAPSRPLRRGPDEGQHDQADDDQLAPEYLGSRHGSPLVEGVSQRVSLQENCKAELGVSWSWIMRRAMTGLGGKAMVRFRALDTEARHGISSPRWREADS